MDKALYALQQPLAPEVPKVTLIARSIARADEVVEPPPAETHESASGDEVKSGVAQKSSVDSKQSRSWRPDFFRNSIVRLANVDRLLPDVAFAPRSNRKEQATMNPKVLGAVVIAASALSSSTALAQWAQSNPDECEAEFASCTGLGTGSTPTGGYRYRQSIRRMAYRQPAAAAAVGAPGAGAGGWGNSYAMYGGRSGYGWNGSWNAYAASNGIVCRPGTYFKGADGLQHPCQ